MTAKSAPSLDKASQVGLSFKRTYDFEVTQELIKLVTEDVIEFKVMCKGNSKNVQSTVPRLGFLSEVGVSSVPSFTPRSDVNFDSKLADRNRNEGASKVSGGSNADVGARASDTGVL